MSKFTISIEGNFTKLQQIVDTFSNVLPQKIVDRAVTFGTRKAKENVSDYDAVDFGELHNSIKGEVSNPQPHYCEGKVKAGTDHCKFVEFGTGIVGAGSPHPDGGWAYDVNGHGSDGWTYYDKVRKRFRHTMGMRSRPYMYDAKNQTRDYMQDYIKREVSKLK